MLCYVSTCGHGASKPFMVVVVVVGGGSDDRCRAGTERQEPSAAGKMLGGASGLSPVSLGGRRFLGCLSTRRNLHTMYVLYDKWKGSWVLFYILYNFFVPTT